MKFKPNFTKLKEILLLLKGKIKNPRKFAITVIGISAVIALIVFGRKSPSGTKWDSVLPQSDVLPQLDSPTQGISEENDTKETTFFFEIYELVKAEYWNIVTEEQIGNVAKAAIEKLTEKKLEKSVSSKAALREVLVETMKDMSDTEKKDFIVKFSDVVLANLEPFGRSRLYNSKSTQDLANTVNNVNTSTSHYEILGIGKEASQDQVVTSYNLKLAELQSQPLTDEVKNKLASVEKAYEVLGDDVNKKIYDELGVDPTIEYRLISPRIFYVRLSKFSPTTVDEFKRVTEKVDTGTTLDTLILDLRGNIGGFTATLPYILGPFIGNDQYAYQFFRRGEKIDFKTVVGWLPSLVRYKKVVILTDGEVKSSGEIFAGTLKKYNVGILVGTKTNGWGTTERVYKLKNQLESENEEYSVLLVDTLTLRDDGLPIQGKGIDPHVNTDNPNWQQELMSYFNYQELVEAVRVLLND